MNKSSAWLLATLTLVAGLLTGAAGTWYLGSQFIARTLAQSDTAETGIAVRVLVRLRSGDSAEAIDLLEAKLDGDLIGLGSSLDRLPPSRREASAVKMLRLAGDYRRQFPRRSSLPEVDAAVAKALALADPEAGAPKP